MQCTLHLMQIVRGCFLGALRLATGRVHSATSRDGSRLLPPAETGQGSRLLPSKAQSTSDSLVIITRPQAIQSNPPFALVESVTFFSFRYERDILSLQVAALHKEDIVDEV